MRHIWIEYRDECDRLDGLSLVFPVVESDLALLDLLIRRLHESWIKFQQNTEDLVDSPEWAVVEAIAVILPTIEGLELDTELLRDRPQLLESLFLFQDGGRAGQIIELHQIDQPAIEPWKEGQPITVSDLPFPTSGNDRADAIALVLCNFGHPDGKALYSWLDADTRLSVQRVLAELSRPADERIGEYLKSVHEFNRQADPELFEKEMFEDW